MTVSSQEKVEKNILELVWNNTNDAIFTIGYEGRILAGNPAFESILGWRPEGLKDDGETSTTLILRADEALYEAKAQWNQYQFYSKQ